MSPQYIKLFKWQCLKQNPSTNLKKKPPCNVNIYLFIYLHVNILGYLYYNSPSGCVGGWVHAPACSAYVCACVIPSPTEPFNWTNGAQIFIPQHFLDG